MGAASEARAKETVASRLAHAGSSKAYAAKEGNLLPVFGISEDKSRPLDLSSALKSSAEGEKPHVNVIVRVDVAGSGEALVNLCSSLATDEVGLRFLSLGVGSVTPGNIEAARAAQAVILAFNVPVSSAILEQARLAKVEVVRFDVVYRIEEELKRRMSAKLEPQRQNLFSGLATVAQSYTFKISGDKTVVAGFNVNQGKIAKAHRVAVVRGKSVLFDAPAAQVLKVHKKDVEAVQKGGEGVIVLKGFGGYEPGDYLVSYEEKVTPRTIGDRLRPTASVRDLLEKALDEVD